MLQFSNEPAMRIIKVLNCFAQIRALLVRLDKSVEDFNCSAYKRQAPMDCQSLYNVSEPFEKYTKHPLKYDHLAVIVISKASD